MYSYLRSNQVTPKQVKPTLSKPQYPNGDTHNPSYQQVSQELVPFLSLKYPTFAFSGASKLLDKIDKSFVNLKDKLKEELSNFNVYRLVRGDGNCLIRAMAYLHFCLSKTNQLESNFPSLNDVNLTNCTNYPKALSGCYDESLLKGLLWEKWQISIEKQIARYKDRRAAYVSLLMEQPYFDVLIILYWRSALAKHFSDNMAKFRDFSSRPKEVVMEDFQSYGTDSESLALHCFFDLLGAQIMVYEVRVDRVISYKYGEGTNKQSAFGLFLHNNHYDLVEKNDSYEIEKPLLEKESPDFYSEVNTETKEGKCIECYYDRVVVYCDTGICKYCTEKMKNLQKHLSSNRTQSGKCQKCYWGHSRLDAKTLLCPSCHILHVEKTQCRKCGKTKSLNGDCSLCDPKPYSPSKLGLQSKGTSYIGSNRSSVINDRQSSTYANSDGKSTYSSNLTTQNSRCPKCTKILATLKQRERNICFFCDNDKKEPTESILEPKLYYSQIRSPSINTKQTTNSAFRNPSSTKYDSNKVANPILSNNLSYLTANSQKSGLSSNQSSLISGNHSSLSYGNQSHLTTPSFQNDINGNDKYKLTRNESLPTSQAMCENCKKNPQHGVGLCYDCKYKSRR